MKFSEHLETQQQIQMNPWDFITDIAEAYGIYIETHKSRAYYDQMVSESFPHFGQGKLFEKLLEVAKYINVATADPTFTEKTFNFFSKYIPRVDMAQQSPVKFSVKKNHKRGYSYQPRFSINGYDDNSLYEKAGEILKETPDDLYSFMQSEGKATRYGLGDDDEWIFENDDFVVKSHPTDPYMVCYEKLMDKEDITEVRLNFLPHFSACFGENIMVEYLS